MGSRILVTVGPASLNREVVTRCDAEGLYLFRINLSHTPLEAVAETIGKIREWSDTPICLDSEGAQIRNHAMTGGGADFVEGTDVRIHFEEVFGDATNISFSPPGIARQLAVGDRVNLDFNEARLQVTEVNGDFAMAQVAAGGHVGDRKAADVNRSLDFDTITEKDRRAIEIGRQLGIRHFALSFANRAADVVRMRELCGADATIISKIESVDGVRNLEAIIETTDEILIDRGDLSRTIALEKIPFMQMRIVSLARSRGTPVFVATNLLESMVGTRRPTRAEVNDVVSTLLMGASGLVLAAETAIGRFPAEAVGMIRSIIEQVDRWTPNTSLDEILNGEGGP